MYIHDDQQETQQKHQKKKEETTMMGTMFRVFGFWMCMGYLWRKAMLNEYSVLLQAF